MLLPILAQPPPARNRIRAIQPPTSVPFVSNTANGRGGGVYFGCLSPARMVNNVIADNQAPQGSALYVRDSSPALLHTTIARTSGGPGVVPATIV